MPLRRCRFNTRPMPAGSPVRAGLLAAAMLILSRPLSADVVINEVGYNMDPRGDTGREWIELFNPDSVSRDLSGYQLYPSKTPRYTMPPGFVMGPRSFLLVHLRLAGQDTDTDLYEGTAPTSNMPNSRGSVAFFTSDYPAATIADFVQYGDSGQTYQSSAAAAGIWTRGQFVDTVPCGWSLGLAADGRDSNRVSDWTGFPSPTPGYSNNPPPCDAAVTGIATDPAVVPPRQPFTLRAAVASRGASAARRFAVTVFSDDDRDSLPGPGERVFFQTVVDSVASPQAVACPMPGLDEGVHQVSVAVACSADAYPWNNCLAAALTAGSPLAINEVMYGPAPGQPEWIELVNRSAAPVDLRGWTIEDLSAAPKIVDTAHATVPPQGYVVLTQTAGLPWAPCPVLRPAGGLPSLNNDDELVCLRDGRGAIVDQVRYSGGWGGGDGVSLERINPFLPPSERWSWGGSVAAARSTPGARNSVYLERPDGGTPLDASPNPFSPGDGGSLIISLALGWNRAAVTLRIYDRLGRPVRTLAQDRELPGITDLVWDGRDDGGSVCAMGLYVISLEARDVGGGGAVRKARTVAVARKL